MIGPILSLILAAAQGSGCPPGTVLIREDRVETEDAIRITPICRRVQPPPPPVQSRSYRYSGSGLVGGTGWQVGYYSPLGASDEVRARAREMVRDQARRAGARYDEQIDFDRYNFVIGVAVETDMFRDLARRVVFEQLMNGQFTARPGYQTAYNSLRGRRFDELGCHSNGAMVCLAALMNRDIMANDVVLYGPQITTESLQLWNQLLAEGRIASLRIELNANDPIPPTALLARPERLSSVTAQALAVPLFFSVGSLETAVRAISPAATVVTYPCGSLPTLDCHDMARYSAHRRRCPGRGTASPTASVPGTTNPGGRGVAEPPSPVCP